jgi:DNA-binding transcriptional ArsR family regulator
MYLEIFLNSFLEGELMGFAETFKALSDPVRREILMLLKEGRMSAGEIGSHFDMTGATISYHLNILKKAELVFEQREKNFIFYELNTSVLEELMLWISDLKGGQSDASKE